LVSLLTGHNCSLSAEEKHYKHPIIPFRCELALSNQQTETRVEDIFEAQSVYDEGAGTDIRPVHS
jgi:hypothetical protein